MGKKKKLIVVLILVIAILAATAIVVSTLFDEETQYEEYILHNCAISAVHSIEVNLEDGTKYTMFADDENYLSWEMQYPEGGKDAQYSSDSMFNVAYACALVRYERKIGIPTQEDLVKYTYHAKEVLPLIEQHLFCICNFFYLKKFGTSNFIGS